MENEKTKTERLIENLDEMKRILIELGSVANGIYTTSASDHDIHFQGHFSLELSRMFEKVLNTKATIDGYVQLRSGLVSVTLT